MKQIFISDLHLDEGREDITSTFESFLENHCQDADELYILGDFFEVWLGDDDDSRFNQRIITLLAALPCRKFVMHGNRDFLLGETFCRNTGAELLDEESIIRIGDDPTLLMHGDSLCTRDTAYMQARTQLRSPAFQQDFLSRTLEERAEFARQIRGESSEHTRDTAMDIMDVTPDEVIAAMARHGVKQLIHGHTHRPDVHHVDLEGNTGIRLVLGDWRPEMVYGIAINGELSLEKFQAGTPL